MKTINSLLDQRTKKSPLSSKMAAMAQQSASGGLSSFTGVFSINELSPKEKLAIEEILKTYADGDEDIEEDLNALLNITSEVKAINNQAALLHGERIKKAHRIFTRYRDGAFTSWLIATYGNRQTPYNLMQYYEFYESLPKPLRPQLESMPRQAVYTLASRNGSQDKKVEIVKSYAGQSKNDMLLLIRQKFPLEQDDRRQQKTVHGFIQALQRLRHQQQENPLEMTQKQRSLIKKLLNEIEEAL